jgi:hypothetical protein
LHFANSFFKKCFKNAYNFSKGTRKRDKNFQKEEKTGRSHLPTVISHANAPMMMPAV